MNNKIEWEYIQGLVTDKEYQRLYRAPDYKAQLEVITRRKNGIPEGKGESYLFWDGYKEEFRTESELWEFYDKLDEVSRRRLRK